MKYNNISPLRDKNKLKYFFCKLHKDRQAILDFTNSVSKLYIYGAGKVGKLMLEYLRDEGISVKGFIVSHLNKCNKYCDLPVFVFEEIKYDLTLQTGIIIAVIRTRQREIDNFLYDNNIKCPLYFQNIFPLENQTNIPMNLTNKNSKYFLELNDLNNMGIKYGTDKSSCYHDYLRKYDFFLNKFRHNDINVLELGIFKDASLKMWSEYFERATIFGVDIDINCSKYSSDRIKCLIKDLSSFEDLFELRKIKASIIIDDGSHFWSHQIKALFTLFENMPEGGCYILEDLETSFSAFRSYSFNDSDISTYEVLSALSEIVTGRCRLNYKYKNSILKLFEEEIIDLANMIDFMAFFEGSCVIIKK